MNRHNRNKKAVVYRHIDTRTDEVVYYGVASQKYQLSPYNNLEQEFPRAYSSNGRKGLHSEFIKSDCCLVDIIAICSTTVAAEDYERKQIKANPTKFNIAHNKQEPIPQKCPKEG